MAVLIIMLVITIFLAIGLGIEIHGEAIKEVVKREWNGAVFLGFMLVLMFVCYIVVFTIPTGVATDYIEKYRNGKIVEQVNYHYINLPDGTRELKDSTTFYVKKK